MIKAEVVFDGDKIFINGYTIYCGAVFHQVCALQITMNTFDTLEQAIKYCLENSDE